MPSAETLDPEMTAAELALGVLDGDERAAATRRVLAEPAFARDVERWRAELGLLFSSWPEVGPPAELQERIEATLDAPSRATRRWRMAAIGSALLAACLLLVVMIPGRGAPPSAPPQVAQPERPPAVAPVELVAALSAPDQPSLSAIYGEATGSVRIVGPVDVAAGRIRQLWAIGDDGVPYSLGLIPSATSATVTLSEDGRRRLVPGATLAVSDEAAGGSPGPAPTGPVIASGPLLRA